MDHYNWTEIPEEKMNPLMIRQVLHTAGMTVARLRLAKGALVPLHQHVNEQLSMVEAGALRFEVAGDEATVRSGEALRIPPHALHMVEAIEDSVVIDLFTPAREDWIRGDDSYLRK